MTNAPIFPITTSSFFPLALTLCNLSQPILLMGRPGTGKSEIIVSTLPALLEKYNRQDPVQLDRAQFPANVSFSPNNNIAVLVERPCDREAPDFRGYLVPLGVKEGKPRTGFTKPDIMHVVESLYEAGVSRVILFLDELLLAPSDTQKALTELFLNKSLGGYKLPDPTWVIAASNYTTDGAGANRPLSILTNRVMVLHHRLTTDEWSAWATRRDIDPLVISFAKYREDLFADKTPPHNEPFLTFRSLTKAANILQEIPPEFPELRKPAVAGLIGESAAIELFAYLDMHKELPFIEDILKQPDKAKLPPDTRADITYATTTLCLSKADTSNIGTLWKYISRLPTENTIMFIKSLQKTHPKVYETLKWDKNFASWLGNNQQLIQRGAL